MMLSKAAHRHLQPLRFVWKSQPSEKRALSKLSFRSIEANSTALRISQNQSRPQIRRLASSSASLDDRCGDNSSASEPTIEQQYSRKTPLEHVLLRPGMYVGPNERSPPATGWILESTFPLSSEQTVAAPIPSLRMVQKELAVIPALIKIFDEILVNASDNRLRYPETTTRIDVVIDPNAPFISIQNNGAGIPVEMHSEEKMYVPELLFGHLLTGSNFDDSEKRLTGGRHGYGAKLTNIFSKEFTVTTVDTSRQRKYTKTWRNNMTESSEAIIADSFQENDSTIVSFVPDLERLTGGERCSSIDPDDYAVMCRRVVDVAGCAAGKLQVTLNGVDVSMASFPEYIDLYRSPEAAPVCFKRINPRWTVGVGRSENGFEAHSFVNGMATTRGGTHVNVIVQQVIKVIQDKVEKVDAELGKMVSAGLIRRHLFIACDTLIENPTFDSQMKEYLTSSPSNYGSDYTLSAKYCNLLLNDQEKGGPGIVEAVLDAARGRQQANLMKVVGGKKTRRQLLSIPKLEDAHGAGSDIGYECTLILTEGDSAKALAVAGLEIIGRKAFGVFPLRGKFLNVRHATITQLASNQEVKSLCAILGLDFDLEYETTEERRTLRYGSVMLMTDQDNGKLGLTL
jgi:DNA topoisomerase-2